MDLDKLQHKLITAARSAAPSDRVPYAFEKRVLAQLKAQAPVDAWAVWGRALWRATAPCIAIMVLLSAWSFFGPTASAPGTDLSQEFENTVLAAADQDQPTDSTW
ncbi:MAG TPA: hypothetical protein VNT26_24455 [Candidatus Sulfotelmatobacter sp.]|nr:hypothetical protein [Candidatus Sulfotelmatobacter sp.]HWI55678.1 hypothetical protein [Bacillota bacterium]